MDSITNNVEDWISGLPVSVLIHILSFLPTKYAVRTSVLSSRWKRHWASVPILDFDNVSERHCQIFNVTSFMNFVDRVLFFHDLPCIQRFNLKSCGEIDMSWLNLWISVLIKRHIRELNVIIYTPKVLFLPLDLFTCTTLVVLTLGTGLRLSVPSSISFPILKTLNVSLALPNNNLTQTLFCNCPKLENLFIEGYVLDSERVNVNISTPLLKMLVIDWYCGYQYRESNIIVNTPILEHLFIRDDFLAHYDLCNLPLLVKADIIVGDYYIEAVGGTKELADRSRVLVEKFSQVKFLSLGVSSMKALHYADDFEWPLFSNLTLLELVVHNCYVRKQLHVLLNNVPNLATLVLTKDSQEEDDDNDDDADDDNEDNDEDDGENDDDDENFEFLGTQGAPACFFSHLREIRISGLKGLKDELMLIYYLLVNGKVLDRMTVNSQDIDIKAARPYLEYYLRFQ